MHNDASFCYVNVKNQKEESKSMLNIYKPTLIVKFLGITESGTVTVIDTVRGE